MRFLFVSDFVENLNSGAAGSLISIGKNLISLGHEVEYIWSKPKEERRIKSFNFYRFFELPFVQYQQIRQVLQNVPYDVIIISQPHAWYAIKKLKKKYPYFLFINRTHGWEKRIELSTWHIDTVSLSLKGKIIKYISYLLICHCSYLTVKYSDAVVCASSSDSDYIKKDYSEFARKIFFISYGLDDAFVGVGLYSRGNRSITKLLYTGQYIKRKGICDIRDALIKIEQKQTDFEITFITPSSSKEAVKKDFAFMGSRLHTIAWLNRSELTKLYQQHDIFLMPSYGEGFGKTSLEAMACGLCIIGYKEGVLEDFGQDRQNSLLSAVGDKKGLFASISFALTHPDVISDYGKSAYQNVQGQTWRKCGEETAKILSKLKSELIIK